MNQSLFQIALVVKDYDDALDFYVNKLGFNLIEDTQLNASKRWVVVKPKGENSCSLLLAKAKNEEETFRVGNQTGGRVFLFMYTDDLLRDHQTLKRAEIKIIREPSEEAFGKVLVFEDLYGNLWDLIQKKKLNE
jgi:catechol 2,3-dioxygenase-like lactoylglutathione lyase family enzyme